MRIMKLVVRFFLFRLGDSTCRVMFGLALQDIIIIKLKKKKKKNQIEENKYTFIFHYSLSQKEPNNLISKVP